MSPAAKVTEQPEILFARLDLKEVLEYAEKFQAAQKAAAGRTGGRGERRGCRAGD